MNHLNRFEVQFCVTCSKNTLTLCILFVCSHPSDQGRPTFVGKGLPPLLWTSSQATSVKITITGNPSA
jgi:hypothetical protein